AASITQQQCGEIGTFGRSHEELLESRQSDCHPHSSILCQRFSVIFRTLLRAILRIFAGHGESCRAHLLLRQHGGEHVVTCWHQGAERMTSESDIPTTWGAQLALAEETLAAAGSPEPREEAVELLSHRLSVPGSELLARLSSPMQPLDAVA